MCDPFRDLADSFLLRAWFSLIGYCSMNKTLLSPHPINPKQAIRPFAVQHPTKRFLTLWICGILVFASYASNLWDRMFDFILLGL